MGLTQGYIHIERVIRLVKAVRKAEDEEVCINIRRSLDTLNEHDFKLEMVGERLILLFFC